MKYFAILFLVVLGSVMVSAQTAIPIGAGSYTSFPPASAGGTAIATANQSLYVVSNNVPIPSNKWWTDLVINQYAGNLWASPLAVSANAQGINISRPNFDTVYDGAHSFLGVNFQPDVPFSIQGQGFSPADARALNWGDWTVTFRMQQASQFMDVTIGHGLPYTWIQFTGVSPQIVLPMAATYFDDSGNTVSFPVTTNHFGLSYSNKIYGIFAPDNTQFTLSGNTINVTFAGASTYLVIGVMPSKTNLAYFSQYAYAVPTNSAMNWVYDPNAGTVTTSWHLATQPWKGAETNTIQGWIPHHWRNTNNFVFNGIQYWVARGLMKCTTSTDFQIVYKFNGILPTLPPPAALGKPNDYDPSVMAAFISSVAANTAVTAETYGGGIDMLRFGQHLAFANLMSRLETNTLATALRNALIDWYSYNPASDGKYFAYYPSWKALTGFPASYGSDQFNDHHFHYGYFTHAAALLCMYDQTFVSNYGPMAKLIAKEYANWDRTDPNFPFLRTFDIWEGHSWTSGFSDPTKGNNQESSSEAMNSWGGLFLLGAMMGDDQMRAAGAMGWAMESESVRQYYFNVPKFYNVNDNNWPPNYTKTVVGILWGSGQECQTYFGADSLYTHGIQWLPPSPVMSYQVEDPAFAKQEFNNMLSERGNVFPTDVKWGDLALSYEAQFDPDSAASQWSSVSHDYTYSGVAYWQIYSTRKLGAIQWQFHISVPTSAVYYSTNSGQYSYVAYNPQSTLQMATVYSNNIAIGTMVLPAYSLVSQPTVGNGTIVTNVVSSSASAGVKISWPTIVNTNYAVQWTANLGANAAWTNLTIPTVGDGTTNSVFDPFGSYPQKFYRVFQSP